MPGYMKNWALGVLFTAWTIDNVPAPMHAHSLSQKTTSIGPITLGAITAAVGSIGYIGYRCWKHIKALQRKEANVALSELNNNLFTERHALKVVSNCTTMEELGSAMRHVNNKAAGNPSINLETFRSAVGSKIV